MAGLGAALLAAGRPDRVRRAVDRAGVLLPWRAVGALRGVASRFVEGFAVLRARRVLLVAFAWSLAHWAAVAAVLWLVTEAFGVALPVSGAAVLMGLTVVGVAVPTPAGIGSYHAAYQVGATLLYGAPPAAAVAAALVLHAMSFLPVALLGVVYMVQEGIRPSAARALASAGPEPSRAGTSATTTSAPEGRRT